MEKFKLSNDGKGEMTDLPKEFRKILYKEITELLGEADERIVNSTGYIGYHSETIPVTYMFSEDTVLGIIKLYDTNFKANGEVMTFRVLRNNMNILLED